MTSADQPHIVGSDDPADSPAAHGVPRLPAGPHRAARAGGARPAKKSAAAPDSVPSSKATPTEAPPTQALVLRWADPPADQLDFEDRHLTRATESEEMSKRYAAWYKDRRKNEWHYLAMGMVAFFVGVTVYLTGFVVVLRVLPSLSPRLVTQVVGIAFAAAGGGVAVRVQSARFRSRGRGRGSKSA